MFRTLPDLRTAYPVGFSRHTTFQNVPSRQVLCLSDTYSVPLPYTRLFFLRSQSTAFEVVSWKAPLRDGICCKQRLHRFATSLIWKEESVMHLELRCALGAGDQRLGLFPLPR